MKKPSFSVVAFYSLLALVAVLGTAAASKAKRQADKLDSINQASTPIAKGVGSSSVNTLYRTDDPERGVSCYSTSSDRLLSCVVTGVPSK